MILVMVKQLISDSGYVLSDLSVIREMELSVPLRSKLFSGGVYNCFELGDLFGNHNIQFHLKRGFKSQNQKYSVNEEKEISSI